MSRTGRIITLSIALIVGMAFSFIVSSDSVSAAAKKPAKPKITSDKVANNTVTLKWGKAKNAKKYQVGIQSAKKKWVKVKTVKKNAKNKKKFTKKNKYKVKAKGKKYIVYQYMFTYSKKKTVTKRSYKFTGLKHNTPYTFAVRSVNGKKYSAWSTVARTTIATENIPEEIPPGTTNTPGAEVPVTIGGITNNLIIGQETTYNFSPIMGLTTEMKSVNIIPDSVRIYNGETPNGSPMETLGCEGTINGIPDSYYSEVRSSMGSSRYISAPGVCESTEYGFSLKNHGGNLEIVKVTNPNTKVYWTLDGTEPVPGQEDLTVAGSEYPLGTLKRERIYSPEPETIKIRGTVNYGETAEVFKETSANYINKCVWMKVYHNDTLVGLLYYEIPDEHLWPYGDE